MLDTQRLAAYGMTAGAVAAQLQPANARSVSGSFAQDNQEIEVEAGRFLGKADDLSRSSSECIKASPYICGMLQPRSSMVRPSRKITFSMPMLLEHRKAKHAENFRR